MGPRGLALFLALISLAGCIRTGPGTEVHLVCEEKSRSPGAPYSLDSMVVLTQVRGANLTPDDERRLLTPVQRHVITAAREPYRNFTATLAPEGPEGAGTWAFRAEGELLVGGNVSVDTYDLLIQENEDGTVDAAPVQSTREPILAPATLRTFAVGVFQATPDLAPERARTPELLSAGWDPELPGCVRLTYAGEGGARTIVYVNADTFRVVHFERQGW